VRTCLGRLRTYIENSIVRRAVWSILEHKSVAKALKKAPKQVRERYEFWKNVIRHSGPEGLRALSGIGHNGPEGPRAITGFNDEALSGQWEGFRSSRLNQAYRVIYRVQRNALTVTVERISKHDYRA
jgi:mRNA-degrading endonuclease RelE of RelBE toxin-antitoxin system